MTEQAANAVSPLSEASPQSLDHYFNLDPLSMTRQSRDAIVKELRRMRVVWEASDASKPAKGAKPLKAVDAKAVADTLTDLGLD